MKLNDKKRNFSLFYQIRSAASGVVDRGCGAVAGPKTFNVCSGMDAIAEASDGAGVDG